MLYLKKEKIIDYLTPFFFARKFIDYLLLDIKKEKKY